MDKEIGWGTERDGQVYGLLCSNYIEQLGVLFSSTCQVVAQPKSMQTTTPTTWLDEALLKLTHDKKPMFFSLSQGGAVSVSQLRLPI